MELLDPLCLAWHLAHALSDLNLSRHDPDNPKKKRRDWKRREGEKSSKSKVCEAKLAKKNEILNKRRQSQKQFAQLGSYASQAQRDIDNARQSFIVEREKNDDDLPDFNELEGPPDESEDEEIEAEIEDWFKIFKKCKYFIK